MSQESLDVSAVGSGHHTGRTDRRPTRMEGWACCRPQLLAMTRKIATNLPSMATSAGQIISILSDRLS